ncbi:MAG: hypothetical protein ACO395_01980 [Pontimonas sp.]
MGHPRHLKYANCAEALRHMDSWSSLHFDSTLRDPLLYVVDDSFDHAFGVEHREHIECSEHIYDGASVVYTIFSVEREASIPTPPREIEYRVTWQNDTDPDRHIAALPACVDLWCHMELTDFDARLVGSAVLVHARYSYSYSFEPVLVDSEDF